MIEFEKFESNLKLNYFRTKFKYQIIDLELNFIEA